MKAILLNNLGSPDSTETKDVKKYLPDPTLHAKYVKEIKLSHSLPEANITPSSTKSSSFLISSPVTFSILPHQSKSLPAGLNIQLPPSISVRSSPTIMTHTTASAIPVELPHSTGLQLHIKNTTNKINLETH